MVTPAGLVKVLDFGLAKAAEEPFAAGDPSESPTATLSPTRAGVILGTAAYMSPEQARGATVDKRTDIWAFGVVLYEMLAGKRAFSGESITDILAAVLRGSRTGVRCRRRRRRGSASCCGDAWNAIASKDCKPSGKHASPSTHPSRTCGRCRRLRVCGPGLWLRLRCCWPSSLRPVGGAPAAPRLCIP